MFDKLFGWSKASKCKKAIKRARYKIKLLKNKRQAIVKQLRKDLVELIQGGYEEVAVNRVEQLMKDESLAAAYELLDKFCEFILTQLSYIRKHKDCPNDIKEAISSLIFASARCGDIPELFVIRKLFGKRYGEKFTITAVELFPGNLVNKKLKENLSGTNVPKDLKYKIVDEIARDNFLQEQVLAIEYYPDWQQVQVKENKGYELVESDAQINASISESKVHPSEIERDVKYVHSPISKPSFVDSSAIVSIVQQYPQNILNYPMQNKVEKVDFPKQLSSVNSCLQNKVERLTLSSSEERISFPSCPEEMIDYVDDIEECHFSIPKVDAYQDEMLLMFNSSGLSKRGKTQFGFDEKDIDQNESPSELSSKSISRRNKRSPKKRSRKRSSSLENLGIVDIGYMIYYQKPCRNPSSHKDGSVHDSRKDDELSLEGTPPSSYSQKKLMLQCFSQKENNSQSCKSKDSNQPRLGLTKETSLLQYDESNFKSQQEEAYTISVRPCLVQDYLPWRESKGNQIKSEDNTTRKNFNQSIIGCSLDQPCYFCLYDDKDCLETQSMKLKKGIEATHVDQEIIHDGCCHCRPLCVDELNKEMEQVTIPQKPYRKSYSGVFECHVNNVTKAEVSPNDSNPRTIDSLAKIETEGTYSRAMTMPQERQRKGKDKMLRTFSCPSQHPNHVHPKLPDYDDIDAKFTALKREYLARKQRLQGGTYIESRGGTYT